MKRFVADTGPLLHLAEAGLIQLLPALGGIFTTPAIAAELLNLGISTLPSWLTVADIPPEVEATSRGWIDDGFLDKGEAEALAYARHVNSDLFLTDDTAAREAARTLGVEVRGSLGIVLSATVHGILKQDAAFAALESRSTLWLSTRVRGEARSALRRIVETR